MSCPICGRPAAPDYRPFCSRRCADVDLGRWLTEGYRIPAEAGDEAGNDTGDVSGNDTGDDAPPKPH